MEDVRRFWTLDPDVAFLNHGSFGACPAPILHRQTELRARMEREPVRFLGRDLEGLLDGARAALADFVGADADDLAFVTNATAGVGCVVRSVALGPGDELLVTDHAYNACRNALEEAAARHGARVVVAAVPFPIAFPRQVLEALLAASGPRTRLALVDHVTSPTALVFPVAEVVRALEGRGIPVIVDGAHAPGMLPLDLDGLGATAYAGNCHKWLCAPKGAAFLHVRRDAQRWVRPPQVSHGRNSERTDRSRFRLEFDWTGTCDPTPYLCVPEAIRWLGALLPGGWPALQAHNRAQAAAARDMLCAALGIAAPCPDSMLGAMASVPFGEVAPAGPQGLDRFQAALDRARIEAPVFRWPGPPHRLLRVSAQVYNRREEVERLCRLVAAEAA